MLSQLQIFENENAEYNYENYLETYGSGKAAYLTAEIDVNELIRLRKWDPNSRINNILERTVELQFRISDRTKICDGEIEDLTNKIREIDHVRKEHAEHYDRFPKSIFEKCNLNYLNEGRKMIKRLIDNDMARTHYLKKTFKLLIAKWKHIQIKYSLLMDRLVNKNTILFGLVIPLPSRSEMMLQAMIYDSKKEKYLNMLRTNVNKYC